MDDVARQKQMLTSLENQHMRHPSGSVYIVNEDLDHAFTKDQIRELEERWRQGEGLFTIAEDWNRDPDEVFLLLFDRARKNKKLTIPLTQLLKEHEEG